MTILEFMVESLSDFNKHQSRYSTTHIYLNHFKVPHLGRCIAVEKKLDDLSGPIIIPSWVRNIGDSNRASALDFKALVGRLIGVFVMDSVAQIRISVRLRPPEIRNTRTYMPITRRQAAEV